MASTQQVQVLVVDEDEDALAASAALLERLGFAVQAETQGLMALKAFSLEPDRFNFAFLDHGMSDLTGLELARRFRRIRPGFPVLLYTGHLATPSAEEAKAVGIDGWVLRKPATLEELSAVVIAALSGWVRHRGEHREEEELEGCARQDVAEGQVHKAHRHGYGHGKDRRRGRTRGYRRAGSTVG